ncbi:MAG: molybdate ABC transporter substrate-binding protein [Deltaproteobacteria bacterium]|nr:molybdate ABC transporter substrate-binding protein [Deltaproteobacteria bacterium]
MLFTTVACTREDSTARNPLVVFAASSLADVFLELEPIFEARFADVDVQFSFSGSQVLRLQIEQGAPADVFASANEDHLELLLQKNLVTKTTHFASNDLALLVSAAQREKLRTFADLPKAKKILIGVNTVPIGKYTRLVLEKAKKSYGASFESQVMKHVVSMESNARMLRAKVELGEADAAIVYKTDTLPLHSRREHANTLGAGKPATYVIDIPKEINVAGEYVVAPIGSSANAEFARRWIDFLQAKEGERVLRSFGFQTGSHDES